MSTEVTVTTLPACDFCGKPARYDAKTNQGPWANMCPTCFRVRAATQILGTGKGQRLVLSSD